MFSQSDKNSFYKTLHAHRSIRQYQNKAVPQDVLDRILAASIRASSSGNMQAYSIIVTSDPHIKQELYPLHFHQNMVIEAPVLLTFCADFHRMREWLKLREAPLNFDNLMSFMIASIDAILASQNAALAAEAEGLGICYMGTTLANTKEIAKVLQCPSHVLPIVGFSLGYSAEEISTRDRLPLTGLVHKETYRQPSAGEIADIYQRRELEGWQRYNANPELRSKIKSSGVKNLAQIYTQLKYTRTSHQNYSNQLIEALFEHGFLQKEDLKEQLRHISDI